MLIWLSQLSLIGYLFQDYVNVDIVLSSVNPVKVAMSFFEGA